MCGCNKNRGSVARAMDTPQAPRTVVSRGRFRGVVAAASSERDVSRPTIQNRLVSVFTKTVALKPHPRNPRIRTRVIESRESFTEKPLEIVDTKLWGPALWRILHVVSIRGATTEAGRVAWSMFPQELDGALPCPECSQHYHDWMRANPLTVTDRNSARDWVLALHNQVNERRSVPAWTADQVMATYGSLTADDAAAALTGIRQLIGVRALRALEGLIALSAAEPEPEPVFVLVVPEQTEETVPPTDEAAPEQTEESVTGVVEAEETTAPAPSAE